MQQTIFDSIPSVVRLATINYLDRLAAEHRVTRKDVLAQMFAPDPDREAWAFLAIPQLAYDVSTQLWPEVKLMLGEMIGATLDEIISELSCGD